MVYDSRVSGQRTALTNIRTVELLEELGMLDAERENALVMLTCPAPLRTSGAPAPNKDPVAAVAFALETNSALAEALLATREELAKALKRIEELEAPAKESASKSKGGAGSAKK